MSNCLEPFRSGIKRGVGVPTVPVSSSHRNGDWTDNDIYEGEMYQDTDTGLVYTRTAANIVKSGSVPNEAVILKFRIYQDDVAIPVVVPYFNPNAYELSSVRDSAGVYRVLGLVGQLMTDTDHKYEIVVSNGYMLSSSLVNVTAATNESLLVETYNNTGTRDDNIIIEYKLGAIANWVVVTVIRYS